MPGYVFGDRTVLGEVFYARIGKGDIARALVVVECTCGQVDCIHASTLTDSKGWGVRCRECAKAYKHSTHGQARDGNVSRLYRAWAAMVARAVGGYSEFRPAYVFVTIDPRWVGSFELFAADVGEHPGDGYSLDRIDNTKGYWPDNVRWATAKQQVRNRSSTTMLTLDGETKALADWAEEYGIPFSNAYTRIVKLGWEPKRALTAPVRHKAKQRNTRKAQNA